MCRINPRVDFAFKKLFGSEENKDILISLINAIVSEKDQVIDLELLNPYNAKNYKNDKLSILDIKAKDSNNHWFNIEMQVADQQWYDKRALYYWSKIYDGQIHSGINYDVLTKTISINILNFNCLIEENYHNVYHILNDETYSLLSDDLEIHFIELEKYDEKLVSILDRWVNFLKKAEYYSQKYMPEELTDEPTIKRALDVLETINFSDDERESYEARLKFLRDEANIVKTAENKARIKGHEEGHEEGLKEGLKEGRKEGLKEGLEEGMKEGKQESRIEIAKNLLLMLDDSKISEITGLSTDQIQKLRQENAN